MRGAIAAILLFLCLPAPPSLVAFGDSIALAIRAGEPTPSFVERVAGDYGRALDNRAVSGTTVAQQLEQIRAYQGSAVDAVWLVCANDLYYRTPAAEFAQAVQAGVDALRARGMRVYLNAVCPPFPRREDAVLVEAYNRALAQISGRIPVDVSFMPPSLFHDGTHPNPSGHAWLALAYERAMRRRMWLPRA